MDDLVSRTFEVPGLVLTEHELAVPLDHGRPTSGERLTLFAREVAAPDGRDRPLLVFLQGGPGNEAPRPTGRPVAPAWLERALRDYRVLMLDQRGTGRSSPVGGLPGLSPQEQADHLAHYRADAIVADAELLRAALGVEQWSVLGQSFGGFCSLRYLSAAPEGLREAFFTGGLPPVGRPVDEVYATTYDVMRGRSHDFHARYPADADRLRTLLDRAGAGELLLPDGSAVSPVRLRSIGNVLGMSDGAEVLHHLLERDPASPGFRHGLAAAIPFTGLHPLYSLVHEACYADGTATRWSAERVLPDDFAADPMLFTGEHVMRAHVAEDPELAPLAEAADLLADRTWPQLYDAEVLSQVDVPCAAAVYVHDAYVPVGYSEETAALLPRMRTWVTDAYEHNGLRAAGDVVLDRLFGLVHPT